MGLCQDTGFDGTENCAHRGINKTTPNSLSESKHSTVINIRDYRWKSYCKELF